MAMHEKSSERAIENVQIRGHIIDSLILPRILDCITQAGGSFRITDIVVGQGRHDPSFAALQVEAPTHRELQELLNRISDHGAVPTALEDCHIVQADIAGAFPEGFYSSTNQKTQVRIAGDWIDVAHQEMDCGIVVDARGRAARCVPMSDVGIGMGVVVGHAGVRVFPYERDVTSQSFEFMNSNVSTEKPKGVAVRLIARKLFEARGAGRKSVVVGGPAIVHTGSVEQLSTLIRRHYVSLLLAGNALATHDIERALFGTSLGVDVDHGNPVEAGHEHHLRAINRIRRSGGIHKAVADGSLESGIMYECVKNNVPFLLAGSIRDDGPLPEVVTDSLEAQRQMRELLKSVDLCLMIATTLHSVAVGNLLPAWVQVVCVDINPSTVIKLNDRGSFQTVGIVTDVEPFLRNLVLELDALETKSRHVSA